MVNGIWQKFESMDFDLSNNIMPRRSQESFSFHTHIFCKLLLKPIYKG